MCEIEELLRQKCDLLVVPLRTSRSIGKNTSRAVVSRSRLASLASSEVLMAAVAEVWRRPGLTWRLLRKVASARSLVTSAKNVAVFPKGLWLGQLARQWQAEHIHCQWAGATATMALIASEVSGVSMSVTAHRWDIAEENLLVEKAGRAAFFRFISEDGLWDARDLGVADLHLKGVVLHLGVDLPRIDAIFGSSGERPVALCPAHLIARKGHRFLLDAMKQLSVEGLHFDLLLAGDGELRRELAEYCKHLGIADRVSFLGRIPHRELLDLYRLGRVTFVVLPSLHEGIPVALIEAMSYGLPVIGTRVGGTPELLRDEAGILVEAEDAAELSAAIRRILTDKRLRQRLADAGRRRIEQRFDVRQIVEQLTALCGGVLGLTATIPRTDDGQQDAAEVDRMMLG